MSGPTIVWIDGWVGGSRPPSDGAVERIVSHSTPSRRAMRREADGIGRRVRVNLDTMPKSRTDPSVESTESLSIEVRHDPATRSGEPTLLDSSVHLVSTRGRKAAAAVEFGHFGTGAGGRFQEARRYPGHAILRRAAGI